MERYVEQIANHMDRFYDLFYSRIYNTLENIYNELRELSHSINELNNSVEQLRR